MVVEGLAYNPGERLLSCIRGSCGYTAPRLQLVPSNSIGWLADV
jgi:hypothetical protein